MNRRAASVSIRGTLLQEIFHNPDNGYNVIRFRLVDDSRGSANQGEAVVVGHYSKPYPEEIYTFWGEWQEHRKFGPQFHVLHYEKEPPQTADGVIKYLSSGLFKGIGRKTAQRIVDCLGEQALAAIAEDAGVLLTVPGLGKKKAEQLAEDLRRHQETETAMVFLYQYGFGPQLALKVIKTYQQDTLSILQEDPYRLVRDVQGIGFKRADLLGRAAGIAIDARERLAAAVMHVLYERVEKTGDTYVTWERLCQDGQALLKEIDRQTIAAEKIEKTIRDLADDGTIVVEADDAGGPRLIAPGEDEADTATERSGLRCYLPSIYWSEVGFANRLAFLKAHTKPEPLPVVALYRVIGELEDEWGIHYSSEQRDAIETVLTQPVSVITGGPGTGKTTVIRGICEAYRRLNPDLNETDIRLAAPTGRAAKRLSESTGLPAMTIHRLLGWQGDTFLYDQNRLLEGRLLIIDETSMMDIWLANQLLRAVSPGMQVVFTGDADQLPSVGPGQVMRDLVAADLAVVTLSHVYRQGEGSGIVRQAHRLLNQAVIKADLLKPEDDVRFIVRAEDQIAPAVIHVAREARKSGIALDQLQVLAPIYKGPNGVNRLNQLLQDLFNPALPHLPSIRVGEKWFRLGDKVIQLHNWEEMQIYNGDIGKVVALRKGEDGSDEMIVRYDQQEVAYTGSRLLQLALAYASTVHKAQGSEYELVILPLSRTYLRMMTRNLLYTAMTRAKKYLVYVGDPDLFMHAMKQDDLNRASLLQQRLVRC